MNDDTTAEEQFLDFKCPSCRKEVSYPAAAAGTMQECFSCSEPLLVPEQGAEGGRIPLPFATAKVKLRKFNGNDWKELLQLFADDEFYAAAPFKVDSEERIAGWLEEDAVVKLTTAGVPFIMAVESVESGKIVGCLSLTFSDAERLQAILYIVVHPGFQKQGFGAETAAAALQFCFSGIRLHRVQGYCESTNAAACALWETAGMRREAEFVQDHKAGGQWANTVAYAILHEEFKTTGS